MATVLVGTSGWSYREWVGSFYPPRTPAAKLLEHYGTRLPTVEAHATYRRRPVASTLEMWCAAVPPSFRFAPKAHAAITHQRDLDGIEDRVADFFAALEPLGNRRGPVMFQLPHREPDLVRLGRILAAIPPGAAAAFELFAGWHTPEVFSALEARDATVVLVDTDAAPAPEVEVGSFAYVRLRREAYTEAQADAWLARLRDLRSGGRDAFVYVRHDDSGMAPALALRLQETLAADATGG